MKKKARKHVVVSPEAHRKFAMACALQATTMSSIGNKIITAWSERILKQHGVEVTDGPK